MKLDRRSFLALGIGTAAGTALSPLPWKLTDDLSIWTQNWPWTPDPAEGENIYLNTTCALCEGGCGITLRRVGERAVKIEGRKGHPVNDGRVCILGVSGTQLLYGPSRVTSPLKRAGKRGEGRWTPISWREATALVAQRLAAIRQQGAAHKIAAIAGTEYGSVAGLWKRFLAACGSPNFIRPAALYDYYGAAIAMTHGEYALPVFDLENADYILSFGSGLLDGWGSPVRLFQANSAWRDKKVKVIQFEPRLSNTAAKADQWIAVRPGQEATLALGLAHVILRESLHDFGFIENFTTGFSSWKARIMEDYTPEKVSAATGVEKSTVTSLALAFARARKPLAVCGRGCGDDAGSVQEFLAVHTLNALVGNINQEGGVWTLPEPDYINWPAPQQDAAAAAGLQMPRADGAGTPERPYLRHALHRLPEAVMAEKPYGLEALLVHNANPCYSQPGQPAFREALARIPFIVSFSSFMDETAMQADLVLPDHFYLERYEDIPCLSGTTRPTIALARPVVAPQHDTRHTGDVIIGIARALGGTVAGAFPWPNYEACLKESLGAKWGPLSKNGYITAAAYIPPAWENAFKTPSMKFAFVSDSRVMPHAQAVRPAGDEGAFPLVLIPYDMMRLTSGYIGAPPFMVKTLADTVLKGKDVFVEINPATAGKLGLKEGDPAVIATPVGTARVRVHLYEGIMPGLVAMPRGLGHTAYDKYLAGKGTNVNMLMDAAPDPVSGLNAAWGIRAKLSKA